MRRRRGEHIADRDLCRGPGRLCQALDVTLALDGADLTAPGAALWVCEPASPQFQVAVATSPRIGISRAADWPWRYYVPGNRYVSARPA
jgi:DNA-3-methyladenine glycosylase